MSDWPGLEAYNTALVSSSCLLAPGLSGASVKLGPWGAPNALSGGFAYIYELLLADGSRKALRLFHTGEHGRAEIMKAAYRDVEGLRFSAQELGDYLVSARWEDPCILAGGKQVPGIVMDWVDSPTLSSWLEHNHNRPVALQDLRRRLALLQDALGAARMVHGDIQTGNMAMRSDGSIVLLDYDGFRRSDSSDAVWESGHMHFRHPASDVPNAMADRFPLLAMDLGLAAMAIDPSLFDRYATGENVLFIGDDYLDPSSSGAIRALSGMPAMERAAEVFTAVCRGPGSAIPTLAEFHSAARISGTGSTAQPRAASQAETITTVLQVKPERHGPYQGQYPVYDPLLYAKLAAAVGSKVELVGRVVAVKEGWTKYGKPYVFINFGDWKHSGTKLIWWSEGLEAAGERAPDDDWEGRWISATGLVDAPYRNERFGTIQYSVTILDSSQVRFISEQEARRRLGTTPGIQPQSTSSRPHTGRTSNADLLAGLKTTGTTTSRSMASSGTAPKVQPQNSTYGGTPQPRPAPNSPVPDRPGWPAGCTGWIIAAVILAFFVYAMGML